MDEVGLVIARLTGEESFVPYLYDDATGKPVTDFRDAHGIAINGNLSIGYGCNLKSGWSKDLAWHVMKTQVLEVQTQLLALTWYLACNTVRRSVLLDIGFNDGFPGLMGFPRMIQAIKNADWVTAQKECQVTNPALHKRYTLLSNLLLTGVIGS